MIARTPLGDLPRRADHGDIRLPTRRPVPGTKPAGVAGWIGTFHRSQLDVAADLHQLNETPKEPLQSLPHDRLCPGAAEPGPLSSHLTVPQL
jgi:hypothetical protein